MRVYCVLGDEEVDEQIQLRDDMIFQLKQQMTTQQQRIDNLEHILFTEGISINIVATIASAAACLFGVYVRIMYVCSCRR